MTSTLPPQRRPAHVRRARTQRRIGMTVLALFVLAGATGLLGTTTRTTSVSSADYELAVTYPRISRPGHAVRVRVEVRKPGGFDGAPITLRYSTDYFEMFDENAFTPEPAGETASPGWTETTFDPPDGDVLVMTVDTRVEPARQRGEKGQVQILDSDGQPVLSAAFSTTLLP